MVICFTFKTRSSLSEISLLFKTQSEFYKIVYKITMGNVRVFTLNMGERHPIHVIKISLWSGVKSENDYMRQPKYNRRLRNRAHGST